jgi:hypothetical protein
MNRILPSERKRKPPLGPQAMVILGLLSMQLIEILINILFYSSTLSITHGVKFNIISFKLISLHQEITVGSKAAVQAMVTHPSFSSAQSQRTRDTPT